MLINHQAMNLPPSVGGLVIKSITWQDFKGVPPDSSPYIAHIYWNINYQFTSCQQGKKPRLKVQVCVSPKSWKIKEELKLLRHEYGHYLIGCLCALAFMKRTSWEQKPSKLSYPEWYKQVLNSCLKEYCAMERLYDKESSHNMNRTGQLEWEQRIQAMFYEFEASFNQYNRPVSRKKVTMPTGRTLASSQQPRGKGRNGSLMRNIKRNESKLPPVGKLLSVKCQKENRNPNEIQNCQG